MEIQGFDYERYYTDLYAGDGSRNAEELDRTLRIRRFETLLHLLKPRRGKILLDVGAGKGELLELAIAAGVEAHGIEISGARLKECQEKNLKVTKGDAYSIPFPDESVDYVVESEVLEHLEHPAKAVDEAYRVLKPNGVFAITVPIEKLRFVGCIHCGKPTPTSTGHLHEFNETKCRDLISQRFRDVWVTRRGVNTFALQRTRRLPFRLWNGFQRIAPKRYSKFIALGRK